MKKAKLAAILLAAAVFSSVFFLTRHRGQSLSSVDDSPRIEFIGATRNVGGSCLVIEAAGVRFAVDCGSLGDEGTGEISSLPDSISFVILTHAHADHCGLLSQLFATGFDGPVYCTEATAKLVPIMSSMIRSVSYPKVAREFFDKSLEALVPVRFGEIVSVQGIEFRMKRAEHLLGAASVELFLPAGDDTVVLVVSGDIGSGNSVLLRPLEIPERADYVVMESTYGGVERSNPSDDPFAIHEPFLEAVASAIASGGDVLVPAFTFGRTQEVMAVLDRAQRIGIISPSAEIYVDSPTAHKVTKVYREMREEMSDLVNRMYPEEILEFPTLREVRSKTSLKVHGRRHDPSIFVSSSGDLEHANSPRHLMRMFAAKENLLCIIGWQAPGSLGARLLAGESPVLVKHQEGREVFEDWVTPALAVRVFDCFSGHADRNGLVRWISGIRGVKKVFLVHGSLENAQPLSEAIRTKLALEVEIPRKGDIEILTAKAGS